MLSMNSLISMRTIAWSSSNRNEASALVSSVLPTPVGPRNMNEPMGRSDPAARTGPPDRGGNGFHRFRLANNPLGQLGFHAQELVLLALEHLVHGIAGPARNNLCHHIRRHLLGHEGTILLRPGRFQCGQLLFQRGNDAIGQFPGALEFTLPLGLVEADARLLQLALELLGFAPSLSFSAFQAVVSAVDFSSSSASSCSSLPSGPSRRHRFSRRRASCSMRRRMISRSNRIELFRLEIDCMRNRAEASSTRSIALSGRNRSVM